MRRRSPVASILIATLTFPCVAGAADLMGAQAPTTSVTSTTTAAADSAARARAFGDRPTHASTGLKTGAVAGAVTGGAGMIFILMLAEALCEGSDCDDITALDYVGLGTLGAGVGAIGGAFFGWVIGSMIPADTGPFPTSPRPADASHPRPPIASLAFQPGFGHLTRRTTDRDSFTFRATLLANIHRRIAVGPEFTYAGFAGGMNAFGGALYLGDRSKRLSPYLVGDVGWYKWSTGIVDTEVTVAGFGIGGGLLWAPASPRTQFGIEGRYHWTPQNIQDPEGYRFVNVGALARVSW